MGNELRQAYKAVCTNIPSVSSSEWVKIIDIGDNSYVRVYCYVGNASVKLSLMSGRKPEQIGYATNKNIKIKYSGNTVYLQPESGPVDVLVKTEIIYGTVNNFPSNVRSSASGDDFKLADSGGIITITNDSDGNQKIIAPGGISMSDATGAFGDLTANSLNITDSFTANNTSISANKSMTINSSLLVAGSATFTNDVSIGRQTLNEFIKSVVKELEYNGSYSQN